MSDSQGGLEWQRLRDLIAECNIEITLLGGNGRRVKMGIAAPPELLCTLRVERGQAAA